MHKSNKTIGGLASNPKSPSGAGRLCVRRIKENSQEEIQKAKGNQRPSHDQGVDGSDRRKSKSKKRKTIDGRTSNRTSQVWRAKYSPSPSGPSSSESSASSPERERNRNTRQKFNSSQNSQVPRRKSRQSPDSSSGPKSSDNDSKSSSSGSSSRRPRGEISEGSEKRWTSPLPQTKLPQRQLRRPTDGGHAKPCQDEQISERLLQTREQEKVHVKATPRQTGQTLYTSLGSRLARHKATHK
jgi:hypothetical protein